MATSVFVLCALASIACAVLLARSYRATGLRLLFWSAICFAAFAVNNLLLLVDVGTPGGQDFTLLRLIPIVIGLSVLIYGFIWDAR